MAIDDVIAGCEAAGFTEPGLSQAVAIAGRESNWEADATDDTRRYSVHQQDGTWLDPNTSETLPDGISPEYSVGPFQINLVAHPDISEEDARDYGKSAAYAYTLSRRGTDFSAWSTSQGLAASMVHAAQEAITAYDAAQAQANQPPPPPDPTPVPLDIAQATVALAAAGQLVDQGDPVQLSRGPSTDQVTLTVSVPRAALVAAWPALADVLPE